MIRGDYWWIYCRDDGMDWWHWARGVSEPLEKGSCREISEIPAPDGADCVLCIPGERVRTHRVRVPLRNRRKVLANLHFILEDKILNDIDRYHLVPIFEAGKSDEITIAVIAKSYLDELVDSFKSQQWNLRYLAPDYFFIQTPDEENWLLDVSAGPILLCMPDINSGSIISGELGSHPPGALLLAMERASVPPRKLLIRVCDDKQAEQLASWSIEVNGEGVELQIIKDQRTRQAALARTDLPPAYFNLLTGAYVMKDGKSRKFKRYIPLTGLAAVLLIMLVADWVVSGLRLESEYTDLMNGINETYLSLFPEARNLSEPRYQMEQALTQARTSTGFNSDSESGFLTRLELISGIFDSADNQLQRLQFDNNGLTLEVSVPDYESLEELQSRLSRELPSRVENAELKDGRVFARLVMEESV